MPCKIVIFNLSEIFELVSIEIQKYNITEYGSSKHPSGMGNDKLAGIWFHNTTNEYRLTPKGLLLNNMHLAEIDNGLANAIPEAFNRLLYKILSLPSIWVYGEPFEIDFNETSLDLIFKF